MTSRHATLLRAHMVGALRCARVFPRKREHRAGRTGRAAPVTSFWRHATRYRGMLVLVLWQAPVQPVVRPNGSIGIMIGGGTDEHADLNCSGDVMRSDRVKHRVAAIEADYNLSERVRIDAAVGVMKSDWDSHDGGFGIVQLRADWKWLGVGAGLAISPDFAEYESSGTAAWPSAYLRGGSAAGAHARLDLFPPNAFSAQQIARLGVGYNAINRDAASGFIGIAGVGSNEATTGVAGELMVPMGDRVALRLEGHYGSGEEHPVTGFALGLRYITGPGGAATAMNRGLAAPGDVERQ